MGKVIYRATCKGKTDGFGCQLNAKLSGIAFCEVNDQWKYVHSHFTNVSHGYRGREGAGTINRFMGSPLTRWRGKANKNLSNGFVKVFNDPKFYYNNKSLDCIRGWFWGNKEPTDCDIVVHIRRGDVSPHRTGDRRRRFIPNLWYNKNIPKLIKDYPESYSITIHSEINQWYLSQGLTDGLTSILDNWPESLKSRVIWKIGNDDDRTCENNMLTAFHDMCSAKVLIQSWSGLSYCAGIINENSVVFRRGNRVNSQKNPLNHWKVI